MCASSEKNIACLVCCFSISVTSIIIHFTEQIILIKIMSPWFWQTLGFHEHDNQGKLVILLVTMYGFFLIQLLVSLFHKNHDHSTV